MSKRIWVICYVVKSPDGGRLFHCHATTDVHPLIFAREYLESNKAECVITSYQELSEADKEILRQEFAVAGYAPDEINIAESTRYDCQLSVPLD